MRVWQAISNKFPRGKRRKAEAAVTLTGAYRRVFDGKGSKQDAQLVLADLANDSGFYRVHPPGTEAETNFSNGKRAAFGRILHFLGLSEEVLSDLQKAAQDEFVADQEEDSFI